ncbi:hypothetical protein NKR23_g5377 [Pleurostoma richardsiae]|uniref:Uncharacterized protein n=1 Tax=Pleurostoma richardsiae TaxID=41990 RepID=A0AA38RGM3_9PEZI|nr:hypothetical protein NKR23_g5377 [Pleurostoma richardsiae]
MHAKTTTILSARAAITAAPDGLAKRNKRRNAGHTALTTTFTPPSECFNGIVTEMGAGNYEFNLAISETSGTSIGYTCYPPGFDTYSWYSPGICPSGFSQIPDVSSTLTFFPSVGTSEHAAYCCMSGFTKTDWEDNCVSSWSGAYQFATYAVQNYQVRSLYTTSGTLDGRSIVEHDPIQIRWKDGDFAAEVSNSTVTATTSGAKNSSSTTVSSTTSSTIPASTSSSGVDEGNSTRPTNKSGLSTGAKAGIGVGIALGVIILLLVAFFCWRRYRKARRAQPTIETPDQPELHDSDIKELEAPPAEPRKELEAIVAVAKTPELDSTGVVSHPDPLVKELEATEAVARTPELDAQETRRAAELAADPQDAASPAELPNPDYRREKRTTAREDSGLEHSPYYDLSRAGPVETHLPTGSDGNQGEIDREIQRLEAEEERIRAMKAKLEDSRGKKS